MRYKTVSVRRGRKYNLGDFESIEAEIFLSAEVEEGEDAESVVELLNVQATDAIEKAVEEEIENSDRQRKKVQITKSSWGKDRGKRS
ncbi:MAG: hypothetical protein HC820_04915 [Hydrococcus sp. RM1_1_31]|nr:hypothetical protein [Hydrococcus sp. RM1_1_31]